MSTAKELMYTKDGKLTPIHIHFSELSGPVAPKFQYSTEVDIKVSSDAILLKYDHLEEFENGKPVIKIQFKGSLSKEELEGILSLLVDNHLLDKDKILSKEKKSMVGISFNLIEISIGSKKYTIEYLLSELKNKDFMGLKNLIDNLKSLKKHSK